MYSPSEWIERKRFDEKEIVLDVIQNSIRKELSSSELNQFFSSPYPLFRTVMSCIHSAARLGGPSGVDGSKRSTRDVRANCGVRTAQTCGMLRLLTHRTWRLYIYIYILCTERVVVNSTSPSPTVPYHSREVCGSPAKPMQTNCKTLLGDRC